MKLYGEITKSEKQADGTLTVCGYASSEVVDAAGEIIKADAIRAALPDFFKYGSGPLREMHQHVAAGSVLKAEVQEDGKTYIEAIVVDPVSVKKVETGVFKGFSVGGKCLGRDPANSTVISKMRLTEISLVDRPCNPEAVMTVVKVDSDFGELDEIEEMEEETVDTSKVDPKVAEAIAEAGEDVDKAETLTLTLKLDAGDAQESIKGLLEQLSSAKLSVETVTELEKSIKALVGAKDAEQPAKTAQETDVKKGMYSVSELSRMLASVNSLLNDTKWEAEMEGDNSPLPKMLYDWLKSGVAILNQMVTEETTEMLAGHNMETQEVEVVEVDKVEKLAPDNDIRKLEEAMAKMTSQYAALDAEFKKINDDLKKALAQPAPAKISINVIGKDEDVVKASPVKEDVVRKADGSIDLEATALEQIKKQHQLGGKPISR